LRRLLITDRARKAVGQALAGQVGPASIRLSLGTGACSWPSFRLTFDQLENDDFVLREDGVDWVIPQDLRDRCGAISIDHVPDGQGERFSITSELPLAATCLGCSTACRNHLEAQRG
jgi:Fe-S cluster assembly iron-binding protein IscA